MSTKRKHPAPRSKTPGAKQRGTIAEAATKDAAAPATAKAPRTPSAPRERDPRLPKAGTVVQRAWHGKTYEVTVGESDFTFKGASYRSLSALAKEITGAASINGIAWWGLSPRPAPKAPAKDAKPETAKEAS
ncbi:MAG: DUF2924 domain-containing protein [Planctomycetota bacterium]